MLTTIQRGINRTWTCVQSYYSAGAAANHARLTTDPHLLSSRIRWNNDAFQTCTQWGSATTNTQHTSNLSEWATQIGLPG